MTTQGHHVTFLVADRSGVSTDPGWLESALNSLESGYVIQNHFLKHHEKPLGVVQVKSPAEELRVEWLRFEFEQMSGEEESKREAAALLGRVTATVEFSLFPDEKQPPTQRFSGLWNWLLETQRGLLLVGGEGVYQGEYAPGHRILSFPDDG